MSDENSALTSTTKEAKALNVYQLVRRSEIRRSLDVSGLVLELDKRTTKHVMFGSRRRKTAISYETTPLSSKSFVRRQRNTTSNTINALL